MDNFKDFLRDNKDKIEKIVRENSKYDEKGQAVIERDDPWRDEDWDGSAKEKED